MRSDGRDCCDCANEVRPSYIRVLSGKPLPASAAAKDVDLAAGDDRYRRVSPLALRPHEGRFTEPTAGAQPGRPEPSFMPQSGRCRRKNDRLSRVVFCRSFVIIKYSVNIPWAVALSQAGAMPRQVSGTFPQTRRASSLGQWFGDQSRLPRKNSPIRNPGCRSRTRTAVGH